MLLRFPWLLSRRRLLLSISLDSGLFSLLYLLWFQHRFGIWPGFSLPLTWLLEFWLLSSYVLGRYHGEGDGNDPKVIHQGLRTLVVMALSVSAYLIYLWVTSTAFTTSDSRGFLLPFLLVFSLASAMVQTFLSYAIQQQVPQSQQWLFLGEPQKLQRLSHHLSWSRLNASLQVYTPDLSEGLEQSATGIMVEDFSKISSEQQQELLNLSATGLLILSMLGWSERVLQRFPPDLLTGADLLRGDFSIPKGSVQIRLKRLGDILVSALLLLVTSPLVLFAALLIRCEDQGPVFYSQLRSGLNGEPFRVWKLRTMRVDAERSGASWAQRGDSRITRIGSLLRLTRIDELPQLWAVLQGTMSLIGPRPERPEFEQELEHQIPHYRLRHRLRPGLSGWAQVNYPYGASVEDAANKLSYDLYYLRNFSFWLDLLILFKTIRLVFNARGAVPPQPEPESGKTS